MYVINHLFLLSNFTEPLAYGSSFYTKADNDYDVIFMCYNCNIT